MARDGVSVKEKMRLAGVRPRKQRARRSRDFQTPIPQDTDVSLVNPSSDASSSSAPQPILSDRDDAEFDDMEEEDEQDKLTRMCTLKALIAALEWFEKFQKEIERIRRKVQAMQTDPSWKPRRGA